MGKRPTLVGDEADRWLQQDSRRFLICFTCAKCGKSGDVVFNPALDGLLPNGPVRRREMLGLIEDGRMECMPCLSDRVRSKL